MTSTVRDSVRVSASCEFRGLHVPLISELDRCGLIKRGQEGLGMGDPSGNKTRIVEYGLILSVVRCCGNEHAFLQRYFQVTENTRRGWWELKT